MWLLFPLRSLEGCSPVAEIQFAQSRCHLSEKTREGEAEDEEKGRHVTAPCYSDKGQRGAGGAAESPELLRENETEREGDKAKPSLQELPNYSSSGERKKSERRNGRVKLKQE